MYYFSTFKQQYNKEITYHFYQSYHGHNSCNAAASHAKKRINTYQQDRDIPFLTAIDLVGSINTLRNHEASLTPPIERQPIKVTKMDGIKSFYMYKFPNPGQIDAYAHSKAVARSKTYNMQGTVFPLVQQQH